MKEAEWMKKEKGFETEFPTPDLLLSLMFLFLDWLVWHIYICCHHSLMHYYSFICQFENFTFVLLAQTGPLYHSSSFFRPGTSEKIIPLLLNWPVWKLISFLLARPEQVETSSAALPLHLIDDQVQGSDFKYFSSVQKLIPKCNNFNFSQNVNLRYSQQN